MCLTTARRVKPRQAGSGWARYFSGQVSIPRAGVRDWDERAAGAARDSEGFTMKHYMLAVHMTEGTPIPSEEEIQQAYRDTDAFNAELQASGAWVFGGGLL